MVQIQWSPLPLYIYSASSERAIANDNVWDTGPPTCIRIFGADVVRIPSTVLQFLDGTKCIMWRHYLTLAVGDSPGGTPLQFRCLQARNL